MWAGLRGRGLWEYVYSDQLSPFFCWPRARGRALKFESYNIHELFCLFSLFSWTALGYEAKFSSIFSFGCDFCHSLTAFLLGFVNAYSSESAHSFTCPFLLGWITMSCNSLFVFPTRQILIKISISLNQVLPSSIGDQQN